MPLTMCLHKLGLFIASCPADLHRPTLVNVRMCKACLHLQQTSLPQPFECPNPTVLLPLESSGESSGHHIMFFAGPSSSLMPRQHISDK